MNAFRNFELEAIRLMGNGVLSPEEFEVIVGAKELTSYEYTGSGYYLTLMHPLLPEQEKTLSKPAVVGIFDDVQAGFVLYIGKNEITLECHTWGGVDVPPDFRDRDVQISTPPIQYVRGSNPTWQSRRV